MITQTIKSKNTELQSKLHNKLCSIHSLSKKQRTIDDILTGESAMDMKDLKKMKDELSDLCYELDDFMRISIEEFQAINYSIVLQDPVLSQKLETIRCGCSAPLTESGMMQRFRMNLLMKYNNNSNIRMIELHNGTDIIQKYSEQWSEEECITHKLITLYLECQKCKIILSNLSVLISYIECNCEK